MKRVVVCLALIASLAACAGGEPLPVAQGPWRQLNPGYWTATPTDLNPQLAADHGH